MVRIVAGKGLNQAEAAAALEEGRDYIIWYFGQGSYTLNRRQNTGTWVIFEGIGAAIPGAPYPVLKALTKPSVGMRFAPWHGGFSSLGGSCHGLSPYA
jgi:hypothetical protein